MRSNSKYCSLDQSLTINHRRTKVNGKTNFPTSSMPLVSKLPIIIISVVRQSDTGNELTCCGLCTSHGYGTRDHGEDDSRDQLCKHIYFPAKKKKKSAAKISPVAYYEIGPPGIGNILNASSAASSSTRRTPKTLDLLELNRFKPWLSQDLIENIV